ncbi:MAG: hypothetical protein AAGF71_00505, partial [Pseudomonadota bacterium]
DPKILKSYNKKQSLIAHPGTLTHACAEHGILFDYGLMVDFAQQTMGEVADQIDGLLSDPKMKMPAFISTTIPVVGTPYFDSAARQGRILPNVRLSDMDGMKLVEWPTEPLEEVARFFGDLVNLRNRQWALARHTIGQALHWRKHLPYEMTVLSVLMQLNRFRRRRGVGSLAQMRMRAREARPTYLATTDPLRAAYRPIMPMPEMFQRDFEPLVVTDSKGQLTEAFQRAREQPQLARSV